MKITCPSCAAKYSIADEKVQARLAKIRCRKCGATIVIDGKVNPPSVTATAGDAGATDVADHTDPGGGMSFSVDFGEGDQRSLTVAEIVAAYNAGQVTGETFLWADGFADWKPLSDIPEVVEALHAAAAPPAMAAAAAAPAPKPTPAPARAAARPARAVSADLFGGIESAGSEEDVATSAPDPTPGLGGAATGSRNESSVLFSLSALTSAASAPKPSAAASRPASSTAATREDSGLIDLKALTAAAVKPDAAPAAPAPGLSPLAASPLGVVPPLGLASPLGTASAGVDLAMPQKSKTGLYVAVAIVAAAVIVAVAFILRPPPPAPVVAVPPPAPAPTPAPTPTPTPTLAATPPATATAEDEEEESKTASKKTTTRRVTSSKKASTSSGSSDTASDTPKPAAPAPKSGNCGCGPADLQCHMRCKTKK